MPSVNGQSNLLALSLIGLSGARREKEKDQVGEGKEPGLNHRFSAESGNRLGQRSFCGTRAQSSGNAPGSPSPADKSSH